MKKVYLFSPLPPVRSGIARYTDTLVPMLQKDYDVHIITDQRESHVGYTEKVHHWKEFRYHRLEEESIVLYQIGNSPYHQYVYPFVFAFPGIVFLHDFIITDSIIGSWRRFYSDAEILEEVQYSLKQNPSNIELARTLMNGNYSANARFLYPELSRTIVEASISTVVHNPDTKKALMGMYPGHPVHYVPMGLWHKQADDHELTHEQLRQKRNELSIPENALVLGAFGLLSAYKRLDRLIELIAILRSNGCPAVLLLAGFEGDQRKLKTAVKLQGVSDFVRCFTNVKDRDYLEMIKIIDIGYSLRFPPTGEFSYSTAELMAFAKPVILLQNRFTAYIPDQVCIKIRPTHEMEDLVEWTLMLHRNPELRRQLGNRARVFVCSHNSLDAMSDGYRSLIEAFGYYRKTWNDRRPQFPFHLRTLEMRFRQQMLDRFPKGLPVSADLRLPVT